MVCVADRENGRVVCFDTDGKFVRALKPEGLGGRIFGISYAKGQVYAVSGPEFNPFAAKPTGYILNIDDGGSSPAHAWRHRLCVPPNEGRPTRMDSATYGGYSGSAGGRDGALYGGEDPRCLGGDAYATVVIVYEPFTG